MKNEEAKVTITERALIQRINRRLAQVGDFVVINHRPYGPSNWDFMRYWVIGGIAGGSVDAFDDVEEYARELGVLRACETVETGAE